MRRRRGIRIAATARCGSRHTRIFTIPGFGGDPGVRRQGSEVVSHAGVATIKKIVRRDEHRDQFKAAVWLAGMNDFAVAQNINVKQTVTDESGAAIMAEIKQLASKLGLPLPLLLGQQKVEPIDAEFTEVKK